MVLRRPVARMMRLASFSAAQMGFGVRRTSPGRLLLQVGPMRLAVVVVFVACTAAAAGASAEPPAWEAEPLWHEARDRLASLDAAVRWLASTHSGRPLGRGDVSLPDLMVQLVDLCSRSVGLCELQTALALAEAIAGLDAAANTGLGYLSHAQLLLARRWVSSCTPATDATPATPVPPIARHGT